MSAKRIAAVLLAGMLLLGLLSGCASDAVTYAAPALLEPKGVTLDTVPVTKGTIWHTSVLEGVVLPGVRELSFSGSGAIKEVYVCAGSHVKAGELLAVMDVSYYESALASQKDSLEYRERIEAITEREQDIQITLQEQTLNSLKASGASDSAVRLQELAVWKLYAQRTEARALWEMDHENMLESIEKLEAQIEAARLIAPCDGTVVSSNAMDGGYAMENVPVMWLAEDSELYISVDQASAVELRTASEVYATVAGKRVEVEFRTEPNRTYITRTTAGGEPTSAFDITKDNGNPVEAGMSAAVFIISDRTEDALIIPATALRFDGSSYVYKIVDGVQVRQSVKTGVQNAGEVQVLEGLQEGDVVYAGT